MRGYRTGSASKCIFMNVSCAVKKSINVLEAVSAARECIPCRPQNCHKVVEVSFHLCTRYIATDLQAQLQRPCRMLLLQAGRSLSTSILRQREALAKWCRSLS